MPLEFLRAMDRRGIRYLLIGRQALVLLGAPVNTDDYDFFLSPDRRDLDELLAVAEKKDLEVSVTHPERKPHFCLLSDTQKLDFFRAGRYTTKEGEAFSFEELYGRKKVIKVRDFSIHVPRIEDLILTKKIRDLPKDREDLKYLQVLLEREP